MVYFNGPSMFLCTQILLITFGSILAKRRLDDYMTTDQIKRFFELQENDIIPDYELVDIKVPPIVKRSVSQEIKVEFSISGKNITSTLKKVTDPSLVTSNTGVWTAFTEPKAHHNVSYEPHPSILEKFGYIVYYHDKKCGSALVLFPWFPENEDSHYAVGVVCGNYTVKHVPSFIYSDPRKWEVSVNKAIGGQLNLQKRDVYTRKHLNNHEYAVYETQKKTVPKSNFRASRSNARRAVYLQPVGPTQHQIPTIVYPKVLVVLDGDMQNTTESLVQYMIAYWNVVDLMYRQLSNPDVRINLAGVIIPQDETASPYITENILNRNEVSASKVLKSTANYFAYEAVRFPRKNYDLIFVMTTKAVCNNKIGKKRCEYLGGMADSSRACPILYSGNFRGSSGVGIIELDWNYSTVTSTAHELGHLFGANHDNYNKTLKAMAGCFVTDGHIMGPFAGVGTNLTWSWCSQNSIRNYLQSSRAWCLQQKPPVISATKQKFKGTFLSTQGQCQNFYGTSNSACTKWNHITDICRRLTCMTTTGCEDTFSLPYDGSECFTQYGTIGYCYNQTCI